MDEFLKLNAKTNKKRNLTKKIKGKNIQKKNKKTPKNKRIILVFCAFSIVFTFLIYFIFIAIKYKNKNKTIKKFPDVNKIVKYANYEKKFNDNSDCDTLDPINLFSLRIKNGPTEICNNTDTKHICYKNFNNYYNDIYGHKNGVICIMENIVIDPSKSTQQGLTFKGPVDNKNFGFPILSKGFINTKCNPNNLEFNYNKYYNTYFNSWNYDYNLQDENEQLEELAPGKVVFFISRNQDSPNLFHGNSEIINAISMMYLFNLEPNEVQVIFLESIDIPVELDPFYDIYKNLISKGGEPIYIKNLKKKYKISKAIHVPINWDSPAYLNLDFPKCKSATKTYQLYNDFVDKYMNLEIFEDKFISENDKLYYPETIIKNHESNIKFEKIVTFHWRKVWPKGRRGQKRILNNGPQLADKLASALPKNILVRLIDTAQFPMAQQISIMRNTDYLVGLHGAGLSLAIFLPQKSIYHEIAHCSSMKVLTMMSALSGHKTYIDIINSDVSFIDQNEMITFDENKFVDKVLSHMKDNNFIN